MYIPNCLQITDTGFVVSRYCFLKHSYASSNELNPDCFNFLNCDSLALRIRGLKPSSPKRL